MWINKFKISYLILCSRSSASQMLFLFEYNLNCIKNYLLLCGQFAFFPLERSWWGLWQMRCWDSWGSSCFLRHSAWGPAPLGYALLKWSCWSACFDFGVSRCCKADPMCSQWWDPAFFLKWGPSSHKFRAVCFEWTGQLSMGLHFTPLFEYYMFNRVIVYSLFFIKDILTSWATFNFIRNYTLWLLKWGNIKARKWMVCGLLAGGHPDASTL